MWVLFVIIYALLKGARDCMKKGALKKSDTFEILFLYTFAGFLMTLPFAKSAMQLGGREIFLAFTKAVLCSSAWIFSIYALKTLSVGVYSILALSGVIFSTIFGIVFFGEVFTIYNFIGLTLVIVGIVLLNAKKDIGGKITFTAVGAVLTCYLFNAGGGVAEKIVLRSATPYQLQFWFMFFNLIFYTCLLFVKREKVNFKALKTNPWILAMSVSLIVGDLLIFAANAAPGSQLMIISLVAQLAVIASIIFSHFIFKEESILYKLMCAGIVIAGVAVPLIFK